MIRINRPDQHWVFLTDIDGRKRVYEADLTHKEAEGMAAAINAMEAVTGQHAEVVGFFPFGPTPGRYAKHTEGTS